jgi:hypothetical protein
MSYMPPGFLLGVLLLLVGIGMCVVFYYYDSKNNKVLLARKKAAARAQSAQNVQPKPPVHAAQKPEEDEIEIVLQPPTDTESEKNDSDNV